MNIEIAIRHLQGLLRELDASDAYAKSENSSPLPSVWQIKNALLRDQAKDALAALDAG